MLITKELTKSLNLLLKEYKENFVIFKQTLRFAILR